MENCLYIQQLVGEVALVGEEINWAEQTSAASRARARGLDGAQMWSPRGGAGRDLHAWQQPASGHA
jgi:hypothetical protein